MTSYCFCYSTTASTELSICSQQKKHPKVVVSEAIPAWSEYLSPNGKKVSIQVRALDGNKYLFKKCIALETCNITSRITNL